MVYTTITEVAGLLYIYIYGCNNVNTIAAACMPYSSLANGLHIIIRVVVVANYNFTARVCTAFISYYFFMHVHSL